MKAIMRAGLWTAGLFVCGALAMAPAMAAAPPAPFFNGFENPGDVDAGDNMTGVTRVPSGTNGVTSATGGWHAEAPAGSFTRYGGYSNTFPAGGFTTSIDIYLDTSKSLHGDDRRFEWTSAISSLTGHRRDFVFNMGTNGLGGYVMSVSNNADGWPANPDRDPYTITTTGWYTFAHRFYDNGAGVLAVDMSVLDAAGNVLKTWTLSDPTDVIGSTVGGNRYGWMYNNQLGNLPVDNIIRTGVSPLQVRKEAVRDALAALVPTGDTKDDQRIGKAISHLDKSLDATRWIDDNTLVSKKGKKVFEEEAKAVGELAKVQSTDVSGYIAELADIDFELASGAIEAASAAYDAAGCAISMTTACQKSASELAKAQQEMADAAEALASLNYVKAIQEYRKAWERADKALSALS